MGIETVWAKKSICLPSVLIIFRPPMTFIFQLPSELAEGASQQFIGVEVEIELYEIT